MFQLLTFKRCFVFLFLTGFSLIPQNCVRAEPPSETEMKKHLQSFDMVWETIRDKHWDAELGGLDWKKVREQMRPLVEKAKSTKEVRKIINDMLDKLKQSHFGIIPAEVYEELEQDKEGKLKSNRGYPGFQVRVIDGSALVYDIDKKSPAWKAGVRKGWKIVKVGDDTVSPLLKKVTKTFKKSTMLERKLADVVRKRLRGKQKESVPVVFENGTGKKVKRDITLVAPPGNPSKFGLMPLIYVDYESKTLTGNVGYFSLNIFADPSRVMTAFKKSIKDNLNAEGYILDIRGNPGGIGLMAVGMGNYFIEKPNQKLGTMFARKGKLHFAFNPVLETYKGPVVILVDGLSASTSEVMAGGLKDLKRAKIIGSRSMGAALPSVFVKLPNGDGFQYAIANYVSVGGKELEGNGVTPDIKVRPTRADLLADRDPALEAAVKWIKEQNRE